MKIMIQRWVWFDVSDERRCYEWMEKQVEDVLVRRQQESNWRGLHKNKDNIKPKVAAVETGAQCKQFLKTGKCKNIKTCQFAHRPVDTPSSTNLQIA